MRYILGSLLGFGILWLEAVVWDWWQRRKENAK